MKKFSIAAAFFLSCTLAFGDSPAGSLSRKERKDLPALYTPFQEFDYRYFLCVAAIFKDEASYLREWIEYYKLLGVEHFRLYNNDSTDNYLEVLRPYIQSGDVTLLDWPSDLSRLGPKEWVPSTQLPALSDAVSYFTGVSKWLAIIDLDEFILPLQAPDLPSFLKEYESEAGVLINWQNFGTSNVWDVPQGTLMIEVLTKRAQEKSARNYPVKSIVRPDRVDVTKKAWCPHTWAYFSLGDIWVLPNHKKWKFGAIDVSKVRINHYVHRTESYFYEMKVAKKERMEGKKLSAKYIKAWKESCNEVQDTKIFRFVPALRERVFCERPL